MLYYMKYYYKQWKSVFPFMETFTEFVTLGKNIKACMCPYRYNTHKNRSRKFK